MGCIWLGITVTAVRDFNYLCIFQVDPFNFVACVINRDIVRKNEVIVLIF